MSHQEQQAVKNQKQAPGLFVQLLLKPMGQRDPQHIRWQPLSVDASPAVACSDKGWRREGKGGAKMQECTMARHCTCVYMLYDVYGSPFQFICILKIS